MSMVKWRDLVISKNMKVADSFLDRLIGLMFKSSMGDKDSLLIKKCNSIHTFFMKYSIDVVFLNKEYLVVKAFYDVKPWRMTRMVFGATQVLEMRAGDLPRDLSVGDRLIICTN